MDLIFNYTQHKVEKKGGNPSSCNLNVYSDDTFIQFSSNFNSVYRRHGVKKHISFEHEFKINLLTGDIEIMYRLINDMALPTKIFKNSTKIKKNDFDLLNHIIDNGIVRGEKKIGYWGVKYYRAVDQIFNIFYNKLKPRLKTSYHKSKSYKKDDVGCLYELIVDFHLDMKNIKGCDNVYGFIQNEYPKKRWLNKNENKYIPTVLDYYGIKSKYLIGELNTTKRNIKIRSLNYLCKLFGDNYIDYLKKIPWDIITNVLPPNKNIHRLKNEHEKASMISLIKNWEKDKSYDESFIHHINKLLTIRDELEKKGYNLKFNAENDYEYDSLYETWFSHKTYENRGYKLKYVFDDDFLKKIESPIIINNDVFSPKILKSEDDYRVEGFLMKNCMSKQFLHGSIYIFISLTMNKKKRINLQYRKGILTQSHGKANSDVPEEFNPAIQILTKRLSNNQNITYYKEKYDFLQK